MTPDILAMVMSKEQATQIGDTLQRIGICEQEIEKAIIAHPEQGKQIWSLFMALRSPHIPGFLHEPFRIHCRQLIRNTLNDMDIDCPTKVEAIIMISLSSMHTAPPRVDVSQPLLADVETMTAFGMEPTRSSLQIDEGYWAELTRANRKFYKKAVGRTRAEIYKESLATGNGWSGARCRILGE